MTPYNRFYRNFGIRKPELMLQPPLPSITRFAFPFHSVYHYAGTGVGDIGPSQNDPMILAQPTPSALEHVQILNESEGKAMRRPIAIAGIMRQHRVTNKRFLPLRDIMATAKNQRTLIAFNYSLLEMLYRYPRTKLTPRIRNGNRLATIVDKMNEVAAQIPHQQFLFVKLPEFLPTVPEMRVAARSNGESVIARFADFDTYLIQQIWTWQGKNRDTSPLSKLSENALRSLNIVFRDAGRFLVINLGELESWRKADKDELPEDDDGSDQLASGSRDRLSLQRSFMAMLIRMTAARNEQLSENLTDPDAPITGESVASDEPVDSEANPRDGDAKGFDDVSEHSDEDDLEETVASQAEEVSRDVSSLSLVGTEMAEVDEDHDVEDVVSEVTDEPRALSTGQHTLQDKRPTALLAAQLQTQQARQEVKRELPALADDFLSVLNDIASAGNLGAAEYRKLAEQADDYSRIKAPDGRPMGEYSVIHHTETQIKAPATVPDIGNVTDKSMLQSTLLDFTNRYVEEFLERDIAGMVVNLQKAGVLVKGYEVEDVETVTGAFRTYKVEVKPIQGKPSVIHFRIPKVTEEGQFVVNNTKYYSRMQRGDFPIRKTNAFRVALTSYYGKQFVDRCSRKVHNYGRWITDHIRAIGLDDTNPLVTGLITGSVFVNDASIPRVYSELSSEFSEFTVNRETGSIRFCFDFQNRLEKFGLPADNKIEADGKFVVGSASSGLPIVMDHDGLYAAVYDPEAGYSYEPFPDFTELLGLQDKNVPLDFAEVSVFGKPIPVGILLGYYLGLSNLVKTLAEPRIVPVGKRANVLPSEWAMYFEDETWVFERKNRMAAMILGGWRDYVDGSKLYPAHEFDRKAVYLNLLESKQLPTRFIREFDLLKQMFVDPITHRLLIKLNEPTDWVGLLTRSCELLLTNQAPDEIDSSFMRIKGYERFAGAVYLELVKGLRLHNGRGNKTNYKLDHSPHAVWQAITSDSSKEQVCETNPIQGLKEQEAVTYSGTGGRSSRTMSKRTRIYPESDKGTISEASVDSSDVGVNIFTSANPQFSCLEGISERYVKGQTGTSSILSTSALVSPGSDQDDAKRVLYASIQHRHTVGCKSYRQNPVRTGYEQVIPHRVSSTYAVTAKQDGEVISASPDGIIVKYKDGKEKGYPLGTSFGKASGLIIPHRLMTPLQTGQKFKAGAAITYNPEFFEPDMIKPEQIVWKSGISITVALLENPDTLEDSSAISHKTADLLKTTVTNIRTIVVDFGDAVHRVVKEGASLETNDILCVIEDASGTVSRTLDEETISTLQALTSQTPIAKHKGVVARVEVFYHGDKSDMTSTLRELADASDKALAKRNRAQGQRVFTGSVDSDYRIENEPLHLDQAVINIYISSEVSAGIGDKGVFANQMKTVFGTEFSDDCQTELGTPIDAIFGAKSIDDRIVESPILIGTTAVLLDVIAKKVVEVYES